MTEQRLSPYSSQVRTKPLMCASKHVNGTDTTFHSKPGKFGHTPYDVPKRTYRDIWCKAMPIRANRKEKGNADIRGNRGKCTHKPRRSRNGVKRAHRCGIRHQERSGGSYSIC